MSDTSQERIRTIKFVHKEHLEFVPDHFIAAYLHLFVGATGSKEVAEYIKVKYNEIKRWDQEL